MKKLLFTMVAILCVSGVFAQKSVAVVRHINWLGHKKKNVEQRLIVSKPGESGKVIELEQRYLDTGMNEAIMSDDQKVIEVFSELLNEGYSLASSSVQLLRLLNREVFILEEAQLEGEKSFTFS